MLHSYKKKLIRANKKDVLLELIREENEIKDTVKGILYWTHNNSHDNLSKGHIVAGCNKIFEIMNHKVKSSGPTKLTDFSLRLYVDKPKHLRKVFGKDNQIVKMTKDILNLVSGDFSYSNDEKDKIYQNCKGIFEEIGSDESELKMVFEFMGK